MNDITQRDYWRHVSDLAEAVMDTIREYGSDLHDTLHETVDSSQWVIYTYRAQKVIEYSSNDCELFDQMGAVEVSDWSTLFTQGAYYALYADVAEAISEAGFDPDDLDGEE